MNNIDTFRQVETFFSEKIYELQPARSIEDANICCEPDEEYFLMSMADDLKNHFPLSMSMSMKDLYISLIFSYYGLNLSEQTTDYLNTNSFRSYADNYDAVINLIKLITVGDIYIDVESINNKEHEMDTIVRVNLSSIIRRHMLGFNNDGGKRKKKRKMSKKQTKRSKKPKKSKRRR